MIYCEDLFSDAESDSFLESEDHEHDSDKADSDIETELYSQIHYVENLNAAASAPSIQNDRTCVFGISPIKSVDLFPVRSSIGPACNVKQGTQKITTFNCFESSTPKDSFLNDFIIGKQTTETNLDKQVQLSEEKNKKEEMAASVSDPKLSKSSEDSSHFESVTCSDNYDSDDSDASVIILDSSNVRKDTEIKEVILLDSTPTSDDDSLDDNSVSPKPSDSEDSLKLSATSSGANHSDDLWHIDHEDRFAFIQRKHSRYHEKRSSFCNNCKKKGHLSKDCLEPRNTKCYICGRNHVWSMCHQRMCGICFEYGHTGKKCRYRTYEITCNLCKMRGHNMHECPDIWRRYHFTTSSDVIIKGPKELQVGVKKYCYNCGHEGHYGHECLRPRMSPDSFPTWPNIISYKDPSRYSKKQSKKNSTGESSNSSRHHDSYPRHRHNKKHRSRSEDLRAMISEKYPVNSRKSGNKKKDKKLFRDLKYIPLCKENDFSKSPSIVKYDEDGHKNKKRKKRDLDKLYAFKRKKQKLNVTV